MLQQTKKMKPDLMLKEKDFSAVNEIKEPSKEFAASLKADLIAVFECLIKFESKLKIDFRFFEFEDNVESVVWRNEVGWWGFWLGIPILTPKTKNVTKRFKRFYSANFNIFKSLNEYIYNDFSGKVGMLQKKLKKLEKLKSLILITN